MKYPIELKQGRALQHSNEEERIKQAILERVITSQKSVAFDRNFGSNLNLLLQQPNDDALHSLVRHYVLECLREENRISVENVECKTASINTVRISIVYVRIEQAIQNSIDLNLNLS